MADTLNTPYTILKPFAENGDKNDIPETVDPELGLMSQDVGFPPITAKPIYEGGVAPNRRDFNGAFNILAQHNFFMQNGGTYTFNQDLSDAIGGYPAGAILSYKPTTGSPYLVQSLIDNNTNNFVLNPALIDGIHWKKINATSEELDNCVKLTGNQGIDGIKLFKDIIISHTNANNDSRRLCVLRTYEQGNTDEVVHLAGTDVVDKNSVEIAQNLIIKEIGGIVRNGQWMKSLVPGSNVSIWGCMTEARPDGTFATYAINPPADANDTQIATTSWVRANSGGVPVGTMLPYGGGSVPSGFLLCNGGAISRTTYANLFSVIGTAYGAGDGNTTFNLPNGTDRYLGGNNRGYARESLPNIKGLTTGVYNGNNTVADGAFSFKTTSLNPSLSGGGASVGAKINFSAHKSNSIYQDNAKVRPDTVLSNIIIKY